MHGSRGVEDGDMEVRRGDARQTEGPAVLREGSGGAGTVGQRQVGGDRTSEGWGSTLWADTEPQILVMYEKPSGVECLPSIEQAIRQWLHATGGGARQGETGLGEPEGMPMQERERTLGEGLRQSRGSERPQGDYQPNGGNTKRWQCGLHWTEPI